MKKQKSCTSVASHSLISVLNMVTTSGLGGPDSGFDHTLLAMKMQFRYIGLIEHFYGMNTSVFNWYIFFVRLFVCDSIYLKEI